ncbi:MAG TPA: GAF domain-containing protein [Anaerolineales bacterium]|nr:GAF domain-containing protein [Anaerolineales bacterium]
MIRKFFSPPVFDKDEDNFRARFINGFAWVVIVLLSIVILGDGIDLTLISQDLVLLGLIGVQGVALYTLQKKNLFISGLIIITLSWIGLTYQAYSADGVQDSIIIAYIAIALLASIVMSWTFGGIVIVASIVAIWAFVFLESNNIITPTQRQSAEYARDLSFIFIAITTLIYFSTTSLRDSIARANKSEEGLRKTNDELQELNQSLEGRVKERIADVEQANQQNEKRAKQFQAIAQVTRAISTNESLETLLPRLTSLISEQFGFYHTGIFLLDENRENAVLRAANSEGGKQMLERGHKLQIGQVGIVGFVTAMGTPRIALDVGSDAVFFDNPYLPDTHSEMALPLRISGEIIGALDVQSTETNAFNEEDIEILSTLAEQVAIAIQNSRTYQTMQNLLEQAQKESGTYIQDAWRILQSEEENIGYRVDRETIVPIDMPLTSAEIKKAMRSKQTIATSGDNATLAIPIRLRNEVVGIIDIRTPDEHQWDEDEVDIAEAVADRLSLALESSLLLKSTQRQAEIERITAEISGKIGATTQFNSILRTTAEELSRVLGGSEVLVQVQPNILENNKELKQDRKPIS